MARARVAPFEAAAVQRNIGRAGNRLHQAIVAAGLTGGNTRGVLPEEERIDMVGDSIAGAEALGRALCALTGTEHTGDHRIGKAGRQIGDRACEGALPVDKKLMDRISRKVQELNDSAQTVRKIEYGAPGEPEEKTVRRFVHALEADLWLRQGLLSGEGPWGGLKDHPRREELVEEVAAKTRHHAGKNRLHWNEARSAVASPELARAIGEWVRGLEELVRKGRLGELPEQGEDAKRRSEAAEIHEARTRHDNPAVRANAFRNLTAFEPTSEAALEELLAAVRNDPAVGTYPSVRERLVEYGTHRYEPGPPPGREEAVRRAETPSAKEEAREAGQKWAATRTRQEEDAGQRERRMAGRDR